MPFPRQQNVFDSIKDEIFGTREMVNKQIAAPI